MDGALFPLTFYCRNAQRCLAKATEAQKSGFAAEELQHLKTFTSLVSETIPAHPNFRTQQVDKQVLELHAYLPEAAKRIREFESSSSGILKSRPHGRAQSSHSSRHPKPPLETNNQDDHGKSRGIFRTGYCDDQSSASEGTKLSSHRFRKIKQQAEQNHQRHGPNGLRVRKENFVRIDDEGEARASSSKRSHNVVQGLATRPVSAPRRMQGAVKLPKEAGPENLHGVTDVSESKGQRNSGLQRGMKEDCEHFRRDMQILTEKAHGFRASLTRDAQLEGMAEKLQRRLVDDMDLAAAAGDNINTVRKHHGRNRAITTEKEIKVSAPRTNMKLRSGEQIDGPEQTAQLVLETSPICVAASVSSSGSSSVTSGQPLSHYVQRLKELSPDSQLEESANLDELLSTPVDDTAAGNHGSSLEIKFASEDDIGPAEDSSELAHELDLVRSSSSALYTCLAHPTQVFGSSRCRPSPPETVLKLNHLESSHQDEEGRLPPTPNDELSYPHVQNDTKNDASLEAKEDEKLKNIHRVLGELKGSVKGMKIWLEVDGQGWRGRVEGLEKELENFREEADDEIIAAKRSLRNEMKVKLGDLMGEMEKIRRQERNEVEVMVEERIEKQLKAQKVDHSRLGSVDMKDEIRLLWAEMDALVKSRQEMQGHLEHLTSAAQEEKEHASREREMLKSENDHLRKQLKSLTNEGVQVRLETEGFQVERENLRLAIDKLRGEGTDMKLEIQSLKNVEKLTKVELESVRTGLTKLREETQELERQKETWLVEGGREHIMIMERVESLSQRYLGGLEKIKTDVFDVKFHCQERIQEFENQWDGFKKQKREVSNFASKQMLLDELDQFRREIAAMVEIERGLVRQTFERESEAIQRQVKDLLFSSKGETASDLEVDVQKWLQSAHDRVFLVTESLKQDLDTLKNGLGRTQEGAEDLVQIISAAKVQRDVVAAAAADASMSATKASNVLTDMTTKIDKTMQSTHCWVKQFQDNLAAEKEIVNSAMYEARKVSQELQKEKEATLVMFQEARQKHQELQDYLERESSRLLNALMVVQNERDATSQAASEAAFSAMKAREVLAELLDTYNLEMAKVRHLSLQLQAGVEHRKLELERDREMAIKQSYNAQVRFSEELEAAMDGWKQAMNTEISKAKEVADDLQKQLRRSTLFGPDPNLRLYSSMGFVDQPALKDYVSQTEKSISGLAAMVKELQDYLEHFSEEQTRRVILNQEENERREQHWNGEISQINQVVRVVEKRVLDTCGDYMEVRKRLKKCEGAHRDLVLTVKEVSSNTSDQLAITVSSWLPRYEAVTRSVNDLSCKVQCVEEKFEGFITRDEGLVRRISCLATTKVEGLKELVASSAAMQDVDQELRDLHERVERSDRVHCQAVREVATRVAQLERLHEPGQPSPGLSSKGEHTDGADAREQGMNQSGEPLERNLTEHTGAMVGGYESPTDSRLLGLESRIEHVASATFTNLRLLDSKVDRVSVGMQCAVEGAAVAETKCGALGAELVKVFRMLTASNSGSSTTRPHSIPETLDLPPTPTPQLSPDFDECSLSHRNHCPTFPRGKYRVMFSPRRCSRIYVSPTQPKTAAGLNRSMTRNEDAKFMVHFRGDRADLAGKLQQSVLM